MNKPNLIALSTGLLFGIGLIISGMTNPAKVMGFLNVSGAQAWDPSLVFVLMTAILVFSTVFHLTKDKKKPIIEAKFSLPTNTKIDKRLITGAAIFGIGWGLAGLCPGAAIAAVSTFSAPLFIFIGAMLAGFLIFNKIDARATKKG